jgi:hypothetical protein
LNYNTSIDKQQHSVVQKKTGLAVDERLEIKKGETVDETTVRSELTARR